MKNLLIRSLAGAAILLPLFFLACNSKKEARQAGQTQESYQPITKSAPALQAPALQAPVRSYQDGYQDMGGSGTPRVRQQAPPTPPAMYDRAPQKELAQPQIAISEEEVSQEDSESEMVVDKPEDPMLGKGQGEAEKRKVVEMKRREAERLRREAMLKKREEMIRKQQEPYNREDYAYIEENDFTSPLAEPLSTFSIDVDKASYANVRRFLNGGSMPPAGAVRLEEMINYFHYDYREPFSSQPFAIHTEVSSCPWRPDHQLVHIGLKGREIDRRELPASNLVFLIDVSGSMNSPDKLGLLKSAFSMLVENLNEQDRVAMVVYAGAAGLVLPSTPANQKGKILNAIDELRAGGSTAGGAGIELAYRTAQEHFIKGGNNRVILATDGDFNVGPSSESALTRLIEDKREQGVFLSVLGFGTGNYQDRRMEMLADKGNGNYAYLDSEKEAKKVLVQEMGGTLHAIAKDVKLQIEFNPTYVKAYRLIGYENRTLAAQDFNDDTKDAGELGAGHTVTALYEIVPHSANTPVAGIDSLRYQQLTPSNLSAGAELMNIKFRYKQPDGDKSTLLTEAVKNGTTTLSATSENFRFSAAVAGFGMLLRDSRYRGDCTYDMIGDLAKSALGKDAYGYRAELLTLLERAKLLDQRAISQD
jgi:Ca-activated chloride channel family protein